MAENTGIPAIMIYYADGVALQSYLASNSNVQATLTPALHVETALSNLVTDFTSRGPSIDYSIKPELVAVGQGIYTATESLDPTGDLYDPTGYTTVEGSSFAAAMVAGAAALVKQANPGFSAAQIKSALVNTRSEERRGGEECRSPGSPARSSRRRHTRCLSDWSSDVCSSDLMVAGAAALVKQANPGFSAAQIKSALVNTASIDARSEEHTSELQSLRHLVCRL